jgi:hypothetical protein
MFDVFYIGAKPNLFPHEQAVNSLAEACEKSRTRACWIVNYLSDYQGFDFLWVPSPWQADQTHVWPSQHQANGGTYLLPKSGMSDINRDHAVINRGQSVPIIAIDHGNGFETAYDTVTRYVSDYLGTLRRVLKNVKHEYVWVVSSVCDYSNFDFTWHPSEWQNNMLHVFASNEQKFGDTFYVHVPSFLQKTESLKVLEWFETLHFVEDIVVPRLPMPEVEYTHDSLATAIWEHEFTTPLVQFHQGTSMGTHAPTVSLWQERTKTVTPLSNDHGTAVVPRECKNYIKTQVYDYPYIDKSKICLKTHPLDIVFISNGEPNAKSNYLQMTVYLANESRYTNRVHVIEGVNGRVAAYHAAARASTTPWFFAVFAKLEVNQRFDWTWQPDRMQQPKHYIFHAGNPVNGLVYGHQAMIAYNRQLVLENTGVGLDFTLDQPHEVVPIISGTAMYAESPWMAWRTAFREVLKLRASLPDVENEYRLKVWLKEDSGTIANGHWSHKGAQDAVEYYEAVNGDPTELRKSYEWDWLASYAFMKRNLLTDR